MQYCEGKGTCVEQPVELRDVLPTFLEASGAAVPDDMDGRPVQNLLCREGAPWRRWIEMEHAECYSPDNYWCALSDGKTKYIRFFRSGKEQLFDLEKDPEETVELSGNRKYARRLKEAREAMVEYLSERGEEWVKDGKLVIRENLSSIVRNIRQLNRRQKVSPALPPARLTSRLILSEQVI